MWTWVLPLAGVVLAAAVVAAVWLYVWGRRRPVPITEAQKLFRQGREHLEAQFFHAAATSGKPRGLRWKECEWGDDVAFARDRKTGHYVALASVTISFEAVEGGDMEGLPAVGNLRNASALFFFDGAHWRATNRAVFNLNPDEALQHFAGQYERVEG